MIPLWQGSRMALEGRPPCRRIPSRRNAFSYSADSGCSEITANNLAVSVFIFEDTDATDHCAVPRDEVRFPRNTIQIVSLHYPDFDSMNWYGPRRSGLYIGFTSWQILPDIALILLHFLTFYSMDLKWNN